MLKCQGDGKKLANSKRQEPEAWNNFFSKMTFMMDYDTLRENKSNEMN